MRGVLFLVALLWSGAAFAGPAGSPGHLDGTHWVLSALPTGAVTPTVGAIAAQISFEGTRFHARLGCNIANGTVAEGRAGAVHMQFAGVTRMRCRPAQTSVESGFGAALRNAARYAIDGTHLRLLDEHGGMLADLAGCTPVAGAGTCG